MKEDPVPENTKMDMKFSLKVFQFELVLGEPDFQFAPRPVSASSAI